MHSALFKQRAQGNLSPTPTTGTSVTCSIVSLCLCLQCAPFTALIISATFSLMDVRRRATKCHKCFCGSFHSFRKSLVDNKVITGASLLAALIRLAPCKHIVWLILHCVSTSHPGPRRGRTIHISNTNTLINRDGITPGPDTDT